MSSSPAAEDQEWEYRHLFVLPSRREDNQTERDYNSPEFVDGLLETVEDLDAAAAEGWRLVRVKLEEDQSGRCWVSAHMKRPKPASDRRADQQPPSTIALPPRTADLAAEIPDEPPIDIERAA